MVNLLDVICRFFCSKSWQLLVMNRLNESFEMPAPILALIERNKLEESACFSWDSHYLDTPFNVSRMMPRLFTASCIFNLQNSQCVETLHLLLTDISDKFSDSSSLFLSEIHSFPCQHLQENSYNFCPSYQRKQWWTYWMLYAAFSVLNHDNY
jgi:hypothetical protein